MRRRVILFGRCSRVGSAVHGADHEVTRRVYREPDIQMLLNLSDMNIRKNSPTHRRRSYTPGSPTTSRQPSPRWYNDQHSSPGQRGCKGTPTFFSFSFLCIHLTLLQVHHVETVRTREGVSLVTFFIYPRSLCLPHPSSNTKTITTNHHHSPSVRVGPEFHTREYPSSSAVDPVGMIPLFHSCCF